MCSFYLKRTVRLEIKAHYATVINNTAFMLRWLIDGMSFLFSSGYEKLILCALLFNYFDYSLSNKLMELKFLLPI